MTVLPRALKAPCPCCQSVLVAMAERLMIHSGGFWNLMQDQAALSPPAAGVYDRALIQPESTAEETSTCDWRRFLQQMATVWSPSGTASTSTCPRPIPGYRDRLKNCWLAMRVCRRPVRRPTGDRLRDHSSPAGSWP